MDSEENKDSELMRNAMKDIGTDDKTLIEIATKRNNNQRMKIRQAYKVMYGRDLMDDLKSELSGDYKNAMLALFTDPIEYDVDSLKMATKGFGTDEDTLIEILASRPGWYINKIKKKYKEKYKNELEKDIYDDTSGNFRNLLISLIQGNRSTNQTPDKDECEKIANELYKAGEKKIGTDEPVFNKYFSLSSPHELLVISREYHKLTGNLLTKAIDKEFSGDVKKLLKTILYAQISPSEYFASRINDAVRGLGTNEKILSRVIVSRNEIDLPIMKQYYKQLYGKDMVKDIEDDVSGDYKKLLLALCNKE
jgi:annexin A7/11